MKYLSEFIGTYFLVSVVIGSGIMAESISGGNAGIALLGNTIATGAILYVIINMFVSISGAHFNPIVSFFFYLSKEIKLDIFLKYLLVQIVGAILAVFVTHYIFQKDIFQISINNRGKMPLLVSEVIATSGLLLTIIFFSKYSKDSIATGVALFITAGYWFTSSTSFANPAVTIARIFTNTFTGINFNSAIYFICGQIIAVLFIHVIFLYLNKIK